MRTLLGPVWSPGPSCRSALPFTHQYVNDSRYEGSGPLSLHLETLCEGLSPQVWGPRIQSYEVAKIPKGEKGQRQNKNELGTEECKGLGQRGVGEEGQGQEACRDRR